MAYSDVREVYDLGATIPFLIALHADGRWVYHDRGATGTEREEALPPYRDERRRMIRVYPSWCMHPLLYVSEGL